MKFLTNVYNPKNKDAAMYVACENNESREQAWSNHLSWLEGKIVGEPKATDVYKVEDLRQMGMIGIYEMEIIKL